MIRTEYKTGSLGVMLDNSRFADEILDCLPIAIIILDQTGVLWHANSYYLQRTGQTKSEILKKKFDLLFAAGDNPYNGKRNAVRMKYPETFINCVRGASGDTLYFKWSTRELTDDENRVRFVVCSGRDVTHEQTMEAEIQKCRCEIDEWSNTLFEKSAMPQLLLKNGAIIDCNKKALSLLGLSNKKHIIGLDPSNISPERQTDGTWSRDKAKSLLAKALDEGFIEFEWVHRKKNGDDLHVIASMSTIKAKGSTVFHVALIDITKRKLAEKALCESEKRFKAIFLGSNDAILLFSDEMIIDCNPRALEIFGYEKKKNLTGRTIGEISPLLQPDGQYSREKAVEHIMKAINDGTESFEWMHLRAGGEVFPAEALLSSLILDGKNVIQATIRDITHKKQAEIALRRSEERYRNLADMTFEGILIHTNGIAHDVNLSFCKMFEYDRDELIGKNVIDMLIHKDYRKEAYQKVRSHSTSSYSVVGCKKNGNNMWIEIQGKPHNFNGKIIRAVAVRDITDRKKMENIQKESEEKFRRITESSMNILIVTDEQGVIRFVSPSITRYTGFAPDDMTGKHLAGFFPENMAGKIVKRLHDALKERTVGVFESNMFRSDGSQAYIEASIVMTVTGGNERELEIYMRDISEQKRLQQEIIRLSEVERKTMGQNLHDGLGQVLTGISIMIGTVARKIKLGKQITYDEMIRIAKKVEEAIDTTKQTARGLYPVTLEKGGLISALREMAITVETDYKTKCRVFNQGRETTPDLNTSYQLYYIVQEAIHNAMKHGKAKKIEIDLIIQKKHIRLTVMNDIHAKALKSNHEGMGLKIMEYRATIIGGSFSTRQNKRSFRIDVEIQYQ